MKILQVTLGFYPATAWGGPVKIVHQNGRELARRGHEVTVYCTNLFDKREVIAPGTFERDVDGLRVVYFHTWRLTRWPGTLGPIWLPDLKNYLARELSTFDVVHLNGYRNLMLLPVTKQAEALGIPLVMQPHGAMPVIVNSFFIKRLYDRLLGQQELKNLSALIALQESEKKQALTHGVQADRIEIIPNGLDNSISRTIEQGRFCSRYGLDSGKPLVLFLGRINRKKGTDMLVKAFAQMDSGLDAQLAIVGPDDGQLGEINGLIQEYGLADRVVLPGLLSGDDVIAAYQDADLFVLPCRADTFPVTMMEACQAGTPMVITDRCEIAHLVAGRVADVVPFDTGQFAAAMTRLLTDRERYHHYQANSAQVMTDTFSVEAVVDKLEALYERVIEEKADK